MLRKLFYIGSICAVIWVVLNLRVPSGSGGNPASAGQPGIVDRIIESYTNSRNLIQDLQKMTQMGPVDIGRMGVQGTLPPGSEEKTPEQVPVHIPTPQERLQDLVHRSSRGDGQAEYELGVLFRDGTTVVQDLRKAATLFERAGDHGIPEGRSALAEMYDTGKGVVRNRGKAKELFYLACKDGFTDACVRYTRIINGR